MDEPMDVDPVLVVNGSLPATPESSNGQVKKKSTPNGTSSNKKRRLSNPEKEEAKRKKLEEKAQKEKEREEERKRREEEKAKKEEEKRLRQEQKQKELEEKMEQKRLADIEKQKQAEERRKVAEEKKRQLDEERRMKQLEKEKKDEEKRLKEEDRIKKLEDKRKAQEQKQRQEDEKKRQQEEELKKKEKEKEKFMGFFRKSLSNDQKPRSWSTDHSLTGQAFDTIGPFLPYQPKPNETLAAVVPQFVKDNFVKGCFDSLFEGQYDSEELYLTELRKGKSTIRTGRKLRICSKKPSPDSEVMIDDDGANPSPANESSKTATTVFKGKLLQFHDNIRPAWFGTWNKKSSLVTGRRPFGQETKYFDYEVDSDEEWDEGGPGESLKGSDDEGNEPEDDYEIDNEFMVPHGYLSGSEEEKAEEDEGVDNVNFRENEMVSRKNLKVKPLKPVSIGCFWQHKMDGNDAAYHILKRYRTLFNYCLKN